MKYLILIWIVSCAQNPTYCPPKEFVGNTEICLGNYKSSIKKQVDLRHDEYAGDYIDFKTGSTFDRLYLNPAISGNKIKILQFFKEFEDVDSLSE